MPRPHREIPAFAGMTFVEHVTLASDFTPNALFRCHYAKGYTLRRPDEAAWKAAKKLGKAARLALVQQWMSAPEPLHPEAPRDEFD